MKLGVPKEIHPGERRVAVTPDSVSKLKKLGFEVCIEAGAGEGARFSDDAYEGAGATIVNGTRSLWSSSDVILKVRPPEHHPALEVNEADLLPEKSALISLIFPGQNKELIEKLAALNITTLALDCVPRISRAQKMDVLSSMANIAGYRAVIEASHHFGSFFGGQITAAGRTRPARVLVIGAGVAGLSAIAAARGLGAEVRAFDTRSACEEQVKSLGATFVPLEFEESGEGAGGYAKAMSDAFLEAEHTLFREQCKEVDIIITTALIPGKGAPQLLLKDMVESMRPGSVIVDLAAEQGGNCELTVADQTVEHSAVTIIGYTDLTSRLSTHASQFFGNNLIHLLTDVMKDGDWNLDMEDEVVRHSLITHEGEVVWPPPRTVVTSPTESKPKAPAESTGVSLAADTTPAAVQGKPSQRAGTIGLILGAAAMLLVGLYAPDSFIPRFSVFVLSCVVGWNVVWAVTHALHTPLMAVTNAISGIIIVGGILQVTGETNAGNVLALVAIFLASMNVFGGFLVTHRMLNMFHK